MAIPRRLQTVRTLSNVNPGSTVSLNAQVIAQKPTGQALNPAGRHLVFLHGLFGKGQSFQFLAKSRLLQQNFTVHLVDLRNHGKSGWSD